MVVETAVREHPILFSAPMVRAVLRGAKTQTRRVVKPQPERDLAPIEIAELCSGMRLGRLKCPYGVPGDRLWVREAHYCDLQPYDDRPVSIKHAFDVVGPSIMESMFYRADADEQSPCPPCCQLIPECQCDEVGRPRWRPSIHMPRWASRITLVVKSVRVERLQAISEDDAIAEGYQPRSFYRELDAHEVASRGSRLTGDPANSPGKVWFSDLWDSINSSPKPVKADGRIVFYQSFPLGGENRTETYRGLPHYITPNPWVWVVEFEREVE